jgi:hypothetical protein
MISKWHGKPRNFNDEIYKKWRLAVYRRDGYKCQWPGCRTKKRKLNAHHVHKWAKFPSLRYVVENGITLCSLHHKLVTGKEDNYILMFSEILLRKFK